jgi:hypothetical protein
MIVEFYRRHSIDFGNAGSKGKETMFRKLMKDKVGTAAVMPDSNLTATRRNLMQNCLGNEGYFLPVRSAMPHNGWPLNNAKG